MCLFFAELKRMVRLWHPRIDRNMLERPLSSSDLLAPGNCGGTDVHRDLVQIAGRRLNASVKQIEFRFAMADLVTRPGPCPRLLSVMQFFDTVHPDRFFAACGSTLGVAKRRGGFFIRSRFVFIHGLLSVTNGHHCPRTVDRKNHAARKRSISCFQGS